MAYIVNKTKTPVSAAQATYQILMGSHQSGDLLCVWLTQDVGGTAISTATSGWTILAQLQQGTACRHAFAYKVAASSSETAPTFSGSTEEWIGSCVVVRDADQTNPFGATPTVGTDYRITGYTSATSFVSGAVTTAADGCLIFHSYGWDGGGSSAGFPRASVNSYRNATKDISSSAVLQTVGYVQQQSAGAVSSATTYKVTATAAVGIVLAVRNATNGALQPDIRPAINEHFWYGNMGTLRDPAITWQASDQFAASIGTYLGSAINTSSTLGVVVAGGAGSDPDSGHGGVTALPNGQNASLTESAAGVGIWVGGTHAVSPTIDLSGKVFYASMSHALVPIDPVSGQLGWIVGFASSATDWAVYQVRPKPLYWGTGLYTIAIAVETATPFASNGTVNWTAVSRLAYFWHRGGSATTSYSLGVRNAFSVGTPIPITGGGSTRPATFADYAEALASWGDFLYADLQAGSQVALKSSVQIGDGGSNTTYFDLAGGAAAFPKAYATTSNQTIGWNAGTDAVDLIVKAGASDTISLGGGVLATDTLQNFTLDAATSTSAAYDFSGLPLVGWAPTWKTGIDAIGVTFKRCGPIQFAGADVTGCLIATTQATATQAAAVWTTSGATVTNTEIDVSGTASGYHIELGTSVTSIDLTNVTFTGTPGTDKIHVKATTGTVTITIDGTTSLVAGDVTSDGATVSIVAPTFERGQNFTGLVSGSKVKVFTTGTQTVLYGTDSSSTSFSWDDATTGSITVDYTIQKAGYLPIRVTGVVLTGAVGTGVVDTPISQVIDRAYVASSGLTYGTTAVVTVGTNPTTNPGTKTFQLTTASTGQNWYSFWIEQWIDKGDTGEALANVAFPIAANGPNSFSLIDGWEFSDGATSIAFLSRDGVRYVNTSGTRTAVWAAILTVGVSSGMRVRYQQSDGGTTQQAAITSGNMDELVQIYGDASHGNFDRTGYLVLKVQEMGYDQAEADAVSLYGTLEDQLYVVGLLPLANGVATGNPALANPPTITDHGASPVTWNSKSFSITITDSAAGNSGTDIMRWLRYNFETGGTFEGKDGFNWHDLMQTNGSLYKTVRGAIYGDTGAALKGVRVVQNDGTTAHNGVTLHTADDGTTVSTTPPAQAVATILADSRVQLYNVTTATEIENVFKTGTSYAYTITTEASIGDTLRLRVCKKGRESGEAFAVWSASGVTFLVSQPEDEIYTAWGIDGATVTEYSLDGTNLQIDANDVDGVSQKTRLGAFYSYALTLEEGIRTFYGALTFLSTAAIRVNVDVADLKIDNINATTALTFSDLDVRLYRSDGSTIIAATSKTIHNDYSGVPDVVETGVSGLTGAESTQLFSLPTASAILSAAQSSPIHANIKQVNNLTVNGAGTEIDPWGP